MKLKPDKANEAEASLGVEYPRCDKDTVNSAAND